jgi:ABC-2 type transport system permease protein
VSATTPSPPLELRDVSGPSAFNGELSRFFDVLWLVSVSEFRSTYANTVLGFLWTIVRPLIFFGVIFLVLREILGVGVDVPGYGESLVIGLVLFTYFSDATTRAVRSISSQEAMVRKLQFPRIIIPLSVNLTACFTLFLNLLAVLPLLLAFGLTPRPSWLLFGVVLAGLITLTTALSLLLSVLFVMVRDTGQAWSLMSRLLFYGSPILYPLEIVPASFVKLIAINPLALLFSQARVWVVDPNAPGPVELAGVGFGLIAPLAIIVGLVIVSLRLFTREAPRVAEAL